VADGVPRRLVVNELHALGNAVVPDVSEHIGRLIVAAEAEAAA
jgi:DNA (cytosine-5)-methyltransferase 1